MKKYLKIITVAVLALSANSCSDSELVLLPPDTEIMEETLNTESQLQSFLNSAYFSVSSVNAYGTDILIFGDVLSDHLYISPVHPLYTNTYNMNYDSNSNELGFYGSMYSAINKCNMIINNTNVAGSANVARMKGEAKIIRAFSYFTLVNFYSPTPSSGINQEYGVPLVLGDYDVSIQPARASVAEVYDQIISDLKAGANEAADVPQDKVTLSKTAAKLLLSRVYLTRRAAGDAQLALQYATEVINNSPSVFAPITAGAYKDYFSATDIDLVENKPETVWELDMTTQNNGVTGVGANKAIFSYYDGSLAATRSLLFTKDFYESISNSDARKGLFLTTNVPVDQPMGAWTTKFKRLFSGGNFTRNNKILRFSEAYLNRIEALYLTGQNVQALQELNAFAASRNGAQYTGTDLLKDILTERDKEFFAEGYRFFDLKRYGLPLIKNAHCTMNCNVPGNDKLFVMPMSQSYLNQNPNLTQYPGY